MKVFITGGSGFVGRVIIQHLIDSQHTVRALVRSPDDLQNFKTIETVVGNTTQPETLCGHLSDCDAVIHLVGIIREFKTKGVTFETLHIESTRSILQAAQEQGVKRYLHMSANGTRENAVTRYHQSKWQGESLVRHSQLDWTIFRPSLIYGQNDQFINMLSKLIRTLPLMPVMGDGQYQLQPVSVIDIADGFVTALNAPEASGKTYSCCGKQILSYDQLLDVIAQSMGQVAGVRKIHQPLWLMKPIVSILQTLPLFPMTSDQLQMLLEGNVCNDPSWASDLKIKQHDLSQDLTDSQT